MTGSLGKLLIFTLLVMLFGGCESHELGKPADSAEKYTNSDKHRIFYVNSYHQGYPWSDDIESAIRKTLHQGSLSPTRAGTIILKSYRLDSKRHSAQKEIQLAAQQALDDIQQFKPEVLIVSDDNAMKYLVEPHLGEIGIPIVFCGVNWSSRRYDLKKGQVTGMIEVQPIDRIIKDLRPFARGNRIALLKGDSLSSRIEAEAMRKEFGIDIKPYLVSTFPEWKKTYNKLQKDTDILLLGNPAAILDWDQSEALKITRNNSLIPTGSWDAWMAPFSLIVHATLPEEQGEWAADTALQILQGHPVSIIPQVRNHKSRIYLNMPLAKRMGIRFPMTLIENATLLGE